MAQSRLFSRWSRKHIIVCTVIVLLVATNVIAWLWLGKARTEVQKAAQARDVSPSTITVPVEKGTVSRTVSADCSTTKEFTNTPRFVTSGEDEAIVTSVPFKAGDRVEAGTVVAEVSSRPIIVAQGDLPAFRTLKVGSRGADVDQLHAFLKDQGMYHGDLHAKYSVQTGDAVKKLYEQAGYDPAYSDPEAVKQFSRLEKTISRAKRGTLGNDEEVPTQDEYDEAREKATPEVPAGEILYLKRTPATLTAMNLSVGQTPQEGQLVTSSGKDVLSCTINATELPDVSQGQRVFLDSSGTSEELKVKRVDVTAEQKTDENSENGEPQPEKPDSAHVIVETPAKFSPYTGPARIEVEEGPRDTLTVPSTAVRTDQNGSTYVNVQTPGQEAHRVSVTVVFEADGVAAVEAKDLHEGDPVEITQ